MAHIPPHFMESLVALEQGEEDGPFAAIASGFLVGLNTGEVDAEGAALYRVVLFTNRHVIEGEDALWAKFNRGDTAERFALQVTDDRGPVWHTYEDYDVAVTGIDVGVLQAAGAEFKFVAEEQLFGVDRMQEIGVAAGDDIYVLGFPMGLAGVEKKYAIVRGGTLARLDDELVRHERGYLVDCLIWPGNSGGPVALRPSIGGITGTAVVGEAAIIGIVCESLSYTEVAVSPQTGRPRITFENNSGLAKVVPVEAMLAAAQPLRPTPGTTIDEGETATERELGAEAEAV